MKPNHPLILLSLSILLLTVACSRQATATPQLTSTSDPCEPENISVEIKPVNDLMREFDDSARLATVLQVDQLVNVVPTLQEVHRRSQDLLVPVCLTDLKSLQLEYMNTVINTLLVFIQVRGTNSEVLLQGVAQAQALHQQYNQELARLIGATYVPPPPPATLDVTSTPPESTTTTEGAFITNPGPYLVNLRAQPNSDSQLLVVMEAGQSIPASGKTEDGAWIQVIDKQGTIAWAFTSLVQVTGFESLPIVTP
jgi:hypothetical protein